MGPLQIWADWFKWGQGWTTDFFTGPPNLKASNFAALQSTDTVFTELKDLNLLKKHIKNQKASLVFKIYFASLSDLISIGPI